MQVTTATPTTLKPELGSPLRLRLTLKRSVYIAVDPDTGLGLRCSLYKPPQLDRLNVCTHFDTRSDAEQHVAKLFGASTLEITRFDSL